VRHWREEDALINLPALDPVHAANGNPPLVSVLTPCYNTAKYLREAVGSVLAQTYGHFEIFLINEGSTDETEAILKELAGADSRIHVRTRPNQGLVETRNELLHWARGKYIAWLDSDDAMTPRRLELQVARLQRDPSLAWIGGAATLTDPEGLPIRTHAFPQDHESICRVMEEEIGCYFNSTTMRRDLAIEAGGFRHPFVISEDYDLCLRLSEIGRVANLPYVVLHYRQHMTSTVNKDRPKSFAYSRLVRELALERRRAGTDRLQRGERVSLEFGEVQAPRRNQTETHRRWAWWALNDGNVRTARKYAFHALRDAPLDRESWRLIACAIRGH
jgi:glycosyltransferase involved in cell wall biosynthesis